MKRFELVSKAMKLACEAHEGQKRKVSGEPYIVHPERVAEMVRPYVDEAGQAAAWLHDVLEDTKKRPYGFPLRVFQIVHLLTRRKSKKDKDRNETKEDYIRRVMKAGDITAAIIKVADRIDNLRDGADKMGPRWLKKYLISSRLIHTMAVEWNGLGRHPLVEELGELIRDLTWKLDLGEIPPKGVA
jgi:GTP pyrophosphokinase/guanosine-3',5'-bis(diphosphate) 3'-pyrophosphohydrolase